VTTLHSYATAVAVVLHFGGYAFGWHTVSTIGGLVALFVVLDYLRRCWRIRTSSEGTSP